jgi:ABC-type nitrate/sulfonate/bicarbonate transport system ATPase subunit
MEQALDRGGDVISSDTAGRVREMLAGVRERLDLGVDHTIVALMGGTGSGKSSLFNAISGLAFAEVGVQRPTTAEVTACVWAQDAGALLDWLQVPTDRRIEREPVGRARGVDAGAAEPDRHRGAHDPRDAAP